jgi:membrane associated rhomboid family serine protease
MGSRPGIKSYRVSFEFFVTPAVRLLLIVNFAVFFLEVLLFEFSGVGPYNELLRWFALIPAAVTHTLPPRLWQPFTYLFLHDIQHYSHILLNMFTLWMFGRELELAWGKNRFLRYYFLTGVGAGLINVLVNTVPVFWGHAYSYVPTIGASGAIYGIMIACALLFPDRRVYVFPIPVPLSMRLVVAIMAGLTFLGTFGLGANNVSHICHLGGMLVGYVYLRRGSFLYSARNTITDWKYRRNRKRFEVYINKHKKEPPSRPDSWVN